MNEEPLLNVQRLRTCFKTRRGNYPAVNGISYSLAVGDTLGVVGESGCGKSVHALSIMRLVPDPPGRIESGEVLFEGTDLLRLSKAKMRAIRGARIAMVFQDPMTSLNPLLTVGFQIMEAIMLHQQTSKSDARDLARRMLEMVEIPDAKSRLDDYPHQFSGGMRQRAMIAMALSCNPRLMIADEPTTALDVTIQAQIIDLVKRLQEKTRMAVIWITHDLGVIAGLARKTNVMYAGHIVERGPAPRIYRQPLHPYTVGLLKCLPRPDSRRGDRLFSIPGMPPDLVGIGDSCPFAQRCSYAVDRCVRERPELSQTDEENHFVACFLWQQVQQRNGRNG